MNRQTKATIFALLSVLCWSTVAPAFKLALFELSVIQTLTISTGVASIVLFFTLLFRNKLKNLKNLKKRDILWSICFAVINPIIYYLVLFSAYDRLPAQIAQSLNYTWPIMLSILAIPILKQKLSFKALVALTISFLGVLAISFQGPINDGSTNDTTGIILALFSSIAWATYWLLQVKSRLDKSIQLFLNFSISFVLLCFLFIITKQGIPHSAKAWLPCIWIGFFEMGITFYLWMSALKYAYRTDVVSNLAFLTPFISLFFINLVLHESISINTVIGLCLIIGGILIQQLVLKNYNGNKIK